MFSIVETENSLLAKEDPYSIPRPGLWPSETSVEYKQHGIEVVEGKCLRAAYYRSKGYKPDGRVDPNLSMKGELGKGAEAQAIDRWKKLGLYKASNVKFYFPEFVISGELDCIIKHPEKEGHDIFYEIKSYYGHMANSQICGSKRPYCPGKPKIEHLLQTLIYKYKYRSFPGEFRIYYVERGDGHRVEFEVGLDPINEVDFQPWWRQIPGPYWSSYEEGKVNTPFKMSDILRRFKKLIKHLQSGTLPKREFHKKWDSEQIENERILGNITDRRYKEYKENKLKKPLGNWQCSYCPFEKQCYSDDIP